MRKLFVPRLLIAAFALTLVAACSDEASSESSSASEPAGAPPSARSDPAIKAPLDWKLPREIVYAMTFSPDGTTLATAGDATVSLWDTLKGEKRAELPDSQRSATSIAFSPDGKLIATGSTGGGINCWDAGSGKSLFSTRLDRKINTIGFAENGATLLIASYYDDHIAIKGFDALSGKERFAAKAKGHVANVNNEPAPREPQAAVFSPDGTLLATASTDSTTWDPNVRLWDVRSGAERDHFGVTGDIESLAFSNDGATLAAGDTTGNVRLWDLRGGGKSLGVFGEADQPALAIGFSPDGKLVAASSQRAVNFYRVPEGTLHSATQLDMGVIYALAFSPGGRFIAFSDNLGGVHVRAVPEAVAPSRDDAADPGAPAAGIVVLEQQHDPRHGRPFLAIAFSSDGKSVAAANEDRTIRLFDVPARQLRFLLEGQPGTPVSLAFSPDGKLLASAAHESAGSTPVAPEPPNSVRVWDVESGKDRGFIETQPRGQPGACFSPDGRSIAAADREGVVRLFDPATLKPRGGFAFKLNEEKLHSISFSPDSKRLAIGAASQMAGKVRIVELASGKELLAREIPKPVGSVAFSPDGRWLAVVGGEVKVFDTSSGREVASPQHRYYASCAAFSPDGKTLATSGAEIKLWEVGTWKQAGEYAPPQSDEFRSIAWSSDGKSLAVAGARGVFLWTPAAR